MSEAGLRRHFPDPSGGQTQDDSVSRAGKARGEKDGNGYTDKRSGFWHAH
jgi:hypothetical protein